MTPLHKTLNAFRCPRLMAFALWTLACAFPAFAKTAEDYLHGASYQYVAGKIQEASVEAEEGLRMNPDDARLKTLAEHLRKMKDQQRGNSGQGGDRNQDKDKPQDDKRDQEPDGPDDQKDPNRDGENGDKQDEKPDENKRDGPGDDESSGRDEEEEGRAAPQPQKMSEEDAKRLLNSFAEDEKKEQAERRKVIRSRAGTEQDW